MAPLKVFLCVFLATTAVLAADEEETGQYNPDLYEKPYETLEPENTEPAEEAEVTEESQTEPLEEAKPQADVPASVPVLPYPLLYSPVAPVIYPAPQFLRFPAATAPFQGIVV